MAYYTQSFTLKSCPFCGGEAVLEPSHRAFVKGETTKVALVKCKKCQARSKRFELRIFGKTSWSKDACEAAANAWNRRATDGE